MPIVPTPGRVVWLYRYNAATGHKGPLAAMVAKVHNDRLINVMGVLEEGDPFGQQKVVLIQDDEPPPLSDYCSWMPYQKSVAEGKIPPTLHAEAKSAVHEPVAHTPMTAHAKTPHPKGK